MKVMTQTAYDALPSDYRGERENVPYALYMDEDGATTWGPVTTLDDQDAGILERRQKALDTLDGPRIGDWIVFSDPEVYRRISDLTPTEWLPDIDSVQTSDEGSWYLEEGGRAMTMSVMCYESATQLGGEPSEELIAESRDAEPIGAVLAYCDGYGIWQYVPPHLESLARDHWKRHVQTVYVE